MPPANAKVNGLLDKYGERAAEMPLIADRLRVPALEVKSRERRRDVSKRRVWVYESWECVAFLQGAKCACVIAVLWGGEDEVLVFDFLGGGILS